MSTFPTQVAQSEAAATAIADMKTGALSVLDSQLGALYLAEQPQASIPTVGRFAQAFAAPAPDFSSLVQPLPGAITTGSDGAQYVVIDFTAKDGDGASLLTQLDALGLQHGSSYGAMASGLLRVDQLGSLLDVANLGHARESLSHTNAGLVTTQADHAEHADIARAGLGVDGTGLKVGVLSDSFDTSGFLGADGQPDTMAKDIATGDLPADTTILQDYSDPTYGTTDEGRGMAQLIHDIAPGAAIEFATAYYGEAGFANNILGLAAAGSQVIVDDVFYYAEPAYQNGVIAQAVNQVAAQGVAYFSSAGNEGFGGFEAQWHDSGHQLFGEELMDFGPGQDYLSVTATGGYDIIGLQWDQPAASAGGPGSASDLDLFLTDASGDVLYTYSADNNLGADPFEIIGFQGVAGDTYYLRVGYFTGPTPTEIKLVDYGGTGTLETTAYNFNTGTVQGHAAAEGAMAVGAADYRGTPAYGSSPPTLESFSSGGPTVFWYDDQGHRYTEPHVHAAPAFTAVDGGDTTFFYPGDNPDQDTYPNFYGTSAAAPDAAAVGALMLQANGGLTPSDIKALLMDSAIDMDNPDTTGFDTGYDSGSGAGLIQADQAVFFAKTLSISNAGATQLYGTHFNDAITAGAGDNLVDGGAGDDTIDGGLGADSLVGGSGDDVYLVDNRYDKIVELAGGGYDVVKASASFTLDANVEKLILTGANLAGTGNAGANEIDGGVGNDTLVGGSGADTLRGGLGADSLSGGDANDVLQGGAGHDVLTGGAGADTFRFDANVAGYDDELTDFSAAEGDKIGLSTAGFHIASLASFDLITGVDPSAAAAKATALYDTSNGNLYWDADGSGAGARVLIAHLDGAPTLSHADFLVF